MHKRPPSTASHERGAPGRSPPAVADSAADTPTPQPAAPLPGAAGNRALSRWIAATAASQALILRGSDPAAATQPFELAGLTIATYADAAGALRSWCADLEREGEALTAEAVAVPAVLVSTRARGLAHAELLAGGEAEPLDGGNADDLKAWHKDYVRAVNAGREAQAFEAGVRARAAAKRLQEFNEALAELEPHLRDRQRAQFRAGDEGDLRETADAIATVLDTGLASKQAIEMTLEAADDMRALAAVAARSPTVVNIVDRSRKVLHVLEKINKVLAAFQLGAAAVGLASGSKTEMESGRRSVDTFVTVVGAGETLLSISSGFSLYTNLYLGPMTSACLSMLATVEDRTSTSRNRSSIEAGIYDNVAWSVEPGGRAMFDYMLRVMRAGGVAEVPDPPDSVDEYFVDNEDEFSAGVGSRGGELPTEGWWLWKETGGSKFRQWVFRNRDHPWGSLYGSMKVPSR